MPRQALRRSLVVVGTLVSAFTVTTGAAHADASVIVVASCAVARPAWVSNPAD
ncbi:hypothetical protein KDL01_35865 [Actinospica durhamensis]|uniref:Uncharacterized protein n=1 Tax=Actinospica durhamensis TaxID=1508375 RepID=A0A941EXB6_9ACTN|nr:hypothetical protein [Actinospica durhamensis]MBR7838701.1 hypothetical protein [Actinospica durhamensis]